MVGPLTYEGVVYYRFVFILVSPFLLVAPEEANIR